MEDDRPFRRIFKVRNPNEPDNHGRPWDGATMNELENHFDDGRSLEEIALVMGRTKNGIASQLATMGMIVNRGGLLFKVERMAWADNRGEHSKGREL